MSKYQEVQVEEGHICSRLHKVWCVPCYFPCNLLFHICRSSVSRHKRRFEENGFDLDLAYISPRIIVHGFPATGLEHIYRNPRLEVRRFLEYYHKDNYKMFNFCCEPGRGYDPNIFNGRVERYPFKDHGAPPLETMVRFAESAKVWLDQHPDHVVNLHCKAGKGRAGLMCCVLLIRSGTVKNAREALELYDRKRVTNNKGLTVPSQRKYVIFYEAIWRKYWKVLDDIGKCPGELPDSDKYILPIQPELHINAIELINFQQSFQFSCRIQIYLGTNCDPMLIFDTLDNDVWANLTYTLNTTIRGNFKILVTRKTGLLGGYSKLFELWHNTLFMEKNRDVIDFSRDQIDIKKKIIAEIGDQIILRLKLDPCTTNMMTITNRGSVGRSSSISSNGVNSGVGSC